MPASDASGRNWLPGRNTATARMVGIRKRETTSVVGWPITRAGLMPMYTFLPWNLRFTNSFVLSEIGIKPSIKSLVMRGISSITAPMMMPRDNTDFTMFITASVLVVVGS